MPRMYLAAAGSGKTTFLLNMAAESSHRFLYTTFTDENADVAKAMLVQKHGCIPPNVTILPWFSFLLEHGVRPFQGAAGFGSVEFVGVDLSERVKNYNKRPTLGYYCNSSNSVYPSKLPELALHCDNCSNGAVMARLNSLFDFILIDEAQDLAGYDFDFVERLLNSGIDVRICGDERQSTYRTNRSRKHRNKSLEQFLVENNLVAKCPIDRDSLNDSHRCCKAIIEFANRLYPDLQQTRSIARIEDSVHSGVWIVPESLVQEYADRFNPIVLRDKSTTKTISGQIAINFGKSKGRTYNDVLIYPVNPVLKWLSNSSKELADQTRSRFYVAVTRARCSAGIVVPDKEVGRLKVHYQIWEP